MSTPPAAAPVAHVIMQSLRVLNDAVMDVQVRMSDNDYKNVLEAGKTVYDACLSNGQRMDGIIVELSNRETKMNRELINSFAAVIIRDMDWKELTVTELRKQLQIKIFRCGVGSLELFDDEMLREVMRKHVNNVLKRRKVQQQDKDGEDAPLFPRFRM